MSKSNTAENQFVALAFNGTAISWAAQANFFAGLHTADPGEAGDQTTSEADYTGYARIAVSRDGAGWTVSGNQAQNTAEITFPECTGGTNSITHVSIGLVASGASQIVYKGALTAPINVSNLITPRFPAGTLVVQED
jgi:hypothetical protein